MTLQNGNPMSCEPDTRKGNPAALICNKANIMRLAIIVTLGRLTKPEVSPKLISFSLGSGRH